MTLEGYVLVTERKRALSAATGVDGRPAVVVVAVVVVVVVAVAVATAAVTAATFAVA